MLYDLDVTLQNLLFTELASEVSDLAKDNIHFDPPDESVAPTSDAKSINLFLYDVRENQGLHRNEPIISRGTNGSVTKNPLPVYVDCSYLVTANAGDTLNEHILLSKVMNVLIRYPVIPRDFISTKDSGYLLSQVEGHLVTSALRPGHLQSMAEFWQAIGGKPKAALHYTVTVPVIQPPEQPGTMVTTLVTGLRQTSQEDAELLITIGGRVLDTQHATNNEPMPVFDAEVFLETTARKLLRMTRTDKHGRFSLVGLRKDETYRLRARAEELGEKEQEIKIDLDTTTNTQIRLYDILLE